MKYRKSSIIILGLLLFVILLATLYDIAGWEGSKPRQASGYNVSSKYFARDLPENYTPEQAEGDGCFVVVNSDIAAGEQLWKEFIKNTSIKKEAAIRIVLFSNESTSYQDILYKDGFYHIFSPASGDTQVHKYRYLLSLEGTMPNAVKSGKVTILTDDKTLTYADIMWQLLSSSPKTISPYETVFVDWE